VLCSVREDARCLACLDEEEQALTLVFGGLAV